MTDYDIEHLSGDLVALLDHYGYDDATFVGHDWGAMVVWGLTLLHPDRVNRIAAQKPPVRPLFKLGSHGSARSPTNITSMAAPDPSTPRMVTGAPAAPP